MTGRDQLVRSAVDLIEERGGAQGVNMRSVAAHAKCAHTNVYNHFDSYEDLLWSALEESMRRYSLEIAGTIGDATGLEAYRLFLEAHMDYAVAHPGLYRFIHFEHRFEGEMPESVQERIRGMRAKLRDFLGGRGEVAERRWQAHEQIFGYVRGELCSLLQGRMGGGEAMHRSRVESNTTDLCRRLLGFKKGS